MTWTGGTKRHPRSHETDLSFQLRGWEIGGLALGAWIAWTVLNSGALNGQYPGTAAGQKAVDATGSALDQALKDGKITQAQYDAYKKKLDVAQQYISAASGGPLGLVQGLQLLAFDPFRILG